MYTAPKVSELVMRAVIAALDNGDICVGKELPSERDLAKTLGVSRGSLRECFVVLEFLGAIKIHNKRKIVIQSADHIQRAITFIQVSSQLDFQTDLMEFRRVNEVAIAEMACLRATEEDLDAIEKVLAVPDRKTNSYANDMRFHEALASAGHNMFLGASIQFASSLMSADRIRFLERLNSQTQVYASHVAIYEAVRSRNAAMAKQEMDRHLNLLMKL